MKTDEVKIEPVIKKEIKIEAPEVVVKTEKLVNYESDSASSDSDPENPSCMAFCHDGIFKTSIFY